MTLQSSRPTPRHPFGVLGKIVRWLFGRDDLPFAEPETSPNDEVSPWHWLWSTDDVREVPAPALDPQTSFVGWLFSSDPSLGNATNASDDEIGVLSWLLTGRGSDSPSRSDHEESS